MLIPPLLAAAVGGTAFVVGLHLVGQPVGSPSARRQRRMASPLVVLGLVLGPSPLLSSGSTTLGLLQVVVALVVAGWLLRSRARARAKPSAVSHPVAVPR